MRQNITGIQNHPHSEKLSEYSMEVPENAWIGRLDDLAWGKSSNLFCFLTEISTGNKYRLSVFSQQNYKPSKEGPAFDEEPCGGIFEIKTEKSKKGFPKFMSAKKLQDVLAGA